MRRSEALLLGSKLLRPVAYCRYAQSWDIEGALHTTHGCALGMMAWAFKPKQQNIERIIKGMHDDTIQPCECDPKLDWYLGGIYDALPRPNVASIIAHIFNEHIVPASEGGKKKCPNASTWTIEQLADWLETTEPELPVEEVVNDLEQVLQAV